MGGDGGSLNNSRMELVRVRKEMMGSKGATSAVEKSVTERDKWTTCAVSRERLATPVVACRLGYLYNKDALIRLLLDKLRKKRMPEFAHVRSLKDVVECKLELSKSPDSVFKCPVTLKEATGGVHFVVIWGCGHVLSQQAVEELKGKKQSSKCVVCGADTVEIILLHPDDAVSYSPLSLPRNLANVGSIIALTVPPIPSSMSSDEKRASRSTRCEKPTKA